MNTSNEEREFLKTYDDRKYEKPSVTADIVIFSVFGDEKKCKELSEPKLKVLLIKRGRPPFKDMYALPGGFVNSDESVDDAARRELQEETGIDCSCLEQVRTFSEPGRDPRRWVITCSYLALIDASKYAVRAGDDAKEAEWFEVSLKRNHEQLWELNLAGSMQIHVTLKEKTGELRVTPQLSVCESENIAFDHGMIITYAILQLRKWIKESRISLAMVPETFTLAQLQRIYEAVLEQSPLPAVIQKKMEACIEK